MTFTVPIEKEVTSIDKNGEEVIKKIYPTFYNLLMTQDLWQGHYQILSIIFRKFIKLNVNTDMIIKNVKLAKLNVNIATVFLTTQTLKMI